MQRTMGRALREELRGPLPRHLQEAQGLGFQDYLLTATRAARLATAARLRRVESERGPLTPFGAGEQQLHPPAGPRGAHPHLDRSKRGRRGLGAEARPPGPFSR